VTKADYLPNGGVKETADDNDGATTILCTSLAVPIAVEENETSWRGGLEEDSAADDAEVDFSPKFPSAVDQWAADADNNISPPTVDAEGAIAMV